MINPIFDIWLSTVCGPGSPVPGLLYNEFENAEEVFYRADKERLESVGGIPKDTVALLLRKEIRRAEEISEYCRKNNVGLLCMADSRYPQRLRSIDSPPAVLYYKGSIPDIDRLLCIAVVGTRKASPNARKAAYTISRDLVLGGACVVSGMALGVDGAAAAGAIDGGGHTIAVLGSGIDVVYPKEHYDLMNRITVGGAVITEFPPHSEPNGKHFPIRNRIISGLSQGTIVVAGDIASGALITARHAQNQGRRIFAVPGDIFVPESEGPNGLIKDGAQLVTCAEDIMMEFTDDYSHNLDVNRMRQLRREIITRRKELASPSAMKVASSRAPEFYSGYVPGKPQKTESPDDEKPAKKSKNDLPAGKNEKEPKTKQNKIDIESLSERERLVYNAIPDGKSVSVDEIADEEIPVSEILVALTMLEISGAVEALPGGLYRKK